MRERMKEVRRKEKDEKRKDAMVQKTEGRELMKKMDGK